MKLGDKVEYKSAGKWLPGVIHAIKKAEPAKGKSVLLGYLVDTGNDESSFDVSHDVRADEITTRVNAELDKKGLEGDERLAAVSDIVKEVITHKDLPESKVITETVRQPEQVEVLPGDIRAVK